MPGIGPVQRDGPYATEELEGSRSGDGPALWHIVSCSR
jgi:hypothetical protein